MTVDATREASGPPSIELPRITALLERIAALVPALVMAYPMIIWPLVYAVPVVDANNLKPVSTEVGDDLLNKVYFPPFLVLAGVSFLALRKPVAREIWPLIAAFAIYMTFSGVSSLWSLAPEVTLRRVLLESMIIATLLLSLLSARRPIDVLTPIFWLFVTAVAFNLAAVLTKPPGPIGHEGIYNHKNTLGDLAAVAIIVCLIPWASGTRLARAAALATVAVCVLLLYKSLAKTATILAFVAPLCGMLLYFTCRVLRLNLGLVLSAVCIVTVLGYLALSQLLGIELGDIFLALFKDKTFTGRTTIWQYVFDQIGERPWLGFGYAGFWDIGPQSPKFKAPGFIVPRMAHAHNGYLEEILELGFVGFVGFVVVLVLCLNSIGRMSRFEGRMFVFFAAMTSYELITNLMEVGFFNPFLASSNLFMLLAGVGACSEAQARTVTARGHGEGVRESEVRDAPAPVAGSVEMTVAPLDLVPLPSDQVHEAMVAAAPPAPFFSVVIPWHGRWDDLMRATASIVRQTERDWELLIVCNGPAAGDAAALPQRLAVCLAAAGNSPGEQSVRALVSPPPDANAARNAGIDAARGRWLALLDADDEFEPQKLARMRAAIEGDAGTAADILLSRGLRVRENGQAFVYPHRLLAPGENISEFFFVHGCNCSTTAVVVRHEIASAVRFTPGLPKFQDNDFLIRAQASGAGIAMLADPLYRWHDGSEIGRVSRGTDYSRQMAWARALAPAFSDRAYHAFCARRVAQYTFPRDLVANCERFWNGWRLGGISPGVTGMMIGRALLPAELARRGVDLYSRLAQPGRGTVRGAPPTTAPAQPSPPTRPTEASGDGAPGHWESGHDPAHARAPHVCIAIPTYKRPNSLRQLLRVLERLETRAQISVVVADNDPVDSAGRAVCRALVAEGYRYPLVDRASERRGIAANRNTLVATALEIEGLDYIAMIDDDSWPESNWIERLLDLIEALGVDVVRAAMKPDFEAAPPAWLARTRLFQSAYTATGRVPQIHAAGNFLARAEIFSAMPQPWFDDVYALTGGEDDDFFLRLKEQ